MTEEINRREPQEAFSEKPKRRQYSAAQKLRIVIAGLRGPESIAELCRGEGINQNLYYRWHDEFLEAGRKAISWRNFARDFKS
jgi:transposase-like protein